MNVKSPLTYGGVVLQKQLTAEGGAPHHGRVVEGGETAAVLVVGGSSQVQQGLRQHVSHYPHLYYHYY